MRCPICQSPLDDGAKTCSNCGCGILPPPAAGTEPTPFVRKASVPRWPLVLSIIGIVAALAVIAVALIPLLRHDTKSSTSTATSGPKDTAAATIAAATSVAAVPATTVPAATTSAATTVASTEPATTSPDTTSPVTTSPETTVAASTSTAATSTTAAAESTTTAPATTAPATPSTTAAAGLPVPVTYSLVEATCTAPDSTDSRGGRISFNPLLTIDGIPDTAWRCPGASIHQALVFSLTTPTDVSLVGAIPGYASSDPFNGTDRFTQNRRVQRARWACLDASGKETASTEQAFADSRKLQLQVVIGFTQCSKVLLEILQTTPSAGRDFTAISEVQVLTPGK